MTMKQTGNYFKQFWLFLLSFFLIGCNTINNDSKNMTRFENQNKTDTVKKTYYNQQISSAVIVQEFSGLVNGGVRFKNGKTIQPPNETIVIRDNEKYNNFIERIPTKEISMKNPAKPSNDPLLKKPHIDFKNNMMLVCIRHDGIYGEIKLLDIKFYATPVEVSVNFLPLTEESKMWAQPISGIGKYMAFVVKRTDKEIRFVEHDN